METKGQEEGTKEEEMDDGIDFPELDTEGVIDENKDDPLPMGDEEKEVRSDWKGVALLLKNHFSWSSLAVCFLNYHPGEIFPKIF